MLALCGRVSGLCLCTHAVCCFFLSVWSDSLSVCPPLLASSLVMHLLPSFFFFSVFFFSSPSSPFYRGHRCADDIDKYD